MCEHAANTEPTGLIPDSGFLMPDPGLLILDSKKAPRKRASHLADIPVPEEVDVQTWNDWVRLRRSKRAPVTMTVLEGARAEAAKAGMSLQRFLEIWCVRGSQGLQAEWIRHENSPAAKAGSTRESFAERDHRLARERWAEARGLYVPDHDVIEVLPTAAIGGES